MENKKVAKYNKFFRLTFYILLIAFFALYLSQATGYYEYELHKRVVLTEEKIKQFEEDVAAGKNIDLENYMEETGKNYKTATSDIGYQISDTVGKYFKMGLNEVFKAIGRMLQE